MERERLVDRSLPFLLISPREEDEHGWWNPLTRRTLCIGVGATVAMAGLGALRYVGSEPLVRPPGGQDEENLVSRCVHCYRCIERAPRR